MLARNRPAPARRSWTLRARRRFLARFPASSTEGVGAGAATRGCWRRAQLGYVPISGQSMRTQSTRAVGSWSRTSRIPLRSEVSATKRVLYRSATQILRTAAIAQTGEGDHHAFSSAAVRRADGDVEPGGRSTSQAARGSAMRGVLERECAVPIDSVATDHYRGCRSELFSAGPSPIGSSP